MRRGGRLFLVAALTFGCLAAAGQTTSWTTGTYAYDGSGNIKGVGTQVYQYDALGRLVIGTLGPSQTQSVTYDAFGNIKTMTTAGVPLAFGVDAGTNRMSRSSDPGVTYSAYAGYDPAGRMTSTLGGLDTFDYDAVDMVTRARVKNVTRVYLYTAGDERLASIPVANGVESCLLINGQQICPEWTLRDASARVLRRLEKNGEAWSWKEDYIYAGGTLVAAEVDGPEKTRHFFADHLGTPRLITGSGGTQIAQHTYYPFGGEASSSTQDNEKLKFTGHERDAESLDYMHARYYAPKWGRFLSVDPGGFDPRKPQSWNRYSYVMNDPINNNDSNGRETNPVTGKSYILDSQILNSASNPRKGFFGMVRRNPDGSRKKHGGNDIAAPRGTPVFAPVSGTVIQSADAGKDGGFVLRIRRSTDENGQSVFVHISHLNTLPNVKVGDTVVEGQANVAEVGNTGNAKKEPPHAHTAVMVGGQTKEHQVDPQQWFRDHPSNAQPQKAKDPCEPNKKC